MKQFLLLSSLFLTTILSAQTLNCGNFCVLGIDINSAHDHLNVTIANNDTNAVNYPTVVVTDAAGDTVGNIHNDFYLFEQPAGDTIVHQITTSLTSFPPGFTGTVYLTDQVWDITCSFSYPMNCVTGINDPAASESFLVYPNPATDNFIVDLNALQHSTALVNITDVTGKTIRSFSTSDTRLTINREGMQSGLYFITVNSNTKLLTKKLVIK